MSKNPQIYNLEEILAGYVLGDLDELELVWLNEQLVANPQLREQITQLESTLNLFPYGLPKNATENNLRHQILTKAQPKSPSTRRLWGAVFTVVTAVSTLFLGIHSSNLRQQIAILQERLEQKQELIALLHQPDNQLVTLRANDNRVSTSGSLLLAPATNMAVLTLQDLEALPGKQVYRLWAVSQGKKIGCSNFTPNARGEVHLNLSSDSALFNASSILITIEPEADTEQPLGQEFLSGFHTEI